MDVPGPLRVRALLEMLDVEREAVLVIRDDTLVTDDALLADTDHVEVRPVISGGAA
jgi:sulfur carrier protein